MNNKKIRSQKVINFTLMNNPLQQLFSSMFFLQMISIWNFMIIIIHLGPKNAVGIVR